MSTLVRLGGKPAVVSDIAGKIVKNTDACGIYRNQNGFVQRIAKYYPEPAAVLIESSKSLKDGRHIMQKLWSWADGATVALTKKSDGFFSLVQKNDSGKVTRSLISKNNKHLTEKGTCSKCIDNKYKRVSFENHVNGDNIAKFLDNNLEYAGKSESNAEYLVKDARRQAEQSFRCIG